MLNTESDKYLYRHIMCEVLRKKEISYITRAEITECMVGKSETEKEHLADKLIEIVLNSKTENEMIEKAKILK
jgi:hypothetical protein